MLLSNFADMIDSNHLCDCFVFDNLDGFFEHRESYFCKIKELLPEYSQYTVSFVLLEHTSSCDLYQLILTFVK